MIDSAALRARLTDVRERIARAANRAGRDPSAIRLVAVSKTFSSAHVRLAAQAGQLDFGENKVQEGLQKIAETSDLPLRWHLIGHLQSNKAKKAALFHAVHAVDGPALLRKIDEGAVAAGRTLEVLIQVDLAGEPTKHGALQEELSAIFEAATQCNAARLSGLMLLPPAVAAAEDARPYFARLRALQGRLAAGGVDPAMLGQLSMGMSHDFEVAVEEGATLVRVGSAIFGDRRYS